jgi:hypothetical protein
VTCDPLDVEDDVGFIGAATLYQGEAKIDVHAQRYWKNDAGGEPARWWGDYTLVGEATLSSGTAYARFSDGSEAEVVLRPSSSNAGRFEVVGRLADSTQVNRKA